MIRIATLTCILMLGACATTGKYEAKLNSWLGYDINSLVNSWGYPAYSFVAPNGNKVYVYQNGGSYTMPVTYQTNMNVTNYGNSAYGSATTTQYGGETLTFWCRTYFEADSNNKIVRWQWQGNSCKSR